MFSVSEWDLIKEACLQRARQWHDQARRADPALRLVYTERAHALSLLADRIEDQCASGMHLALDLDLDLADRLVASHR